MTDRLEKKWRLWVLVLILGLAFGLRAYRLGAESLWYDETVSVYLAAQSMPDLIAHTAGDIHPPGYYLLLHGWTRLAGSSDFAVAFPSFFFGMLLVALAYLLSNRLWGPRTGMLAALLVAVSPFNLWYSQEVRMYTLGAALGMGAFLAILPRLTAHSSRPPAWSRLALYALCGAAGLWVLYYFAFLLVALNLMVGLWWLARWRRGRVGVGWLGRWLLAQLAILVLYAPWLPIAWRQATQPPVPPWRSFTGLGDLLLQTWSALCLGQSVEPTRVWPVLLLFGVLFALGLLGRHLRPSWRQGWLVRAEATPWFLAGYVFGPVFLIYLASFLTPLFHVRYVFTYSTPFYVLLAAGLAWLWQRARWIALLALSIVLIACGLSIHAYHTDPRYASDDHRAAVQFLAGRWRPGDAILINAGYAYTALLTYWDGDPIEWRGRLSGDWPVVERAASERGPVVVQSGTVNGDPSLGWGDPDSDFYALSWAETEEALARLFDGYHRLWVYRIYDTVTDPEGDIRDWLTAHGTLFEERVFAGESQLRVQGYLTGRAPRDADDQPFEEGLADGSLHLEAYTPWPSTVEAGEDLDLALVWRVEAPPPDDAILFAGLFDDQGRRWAQTDERPLGSLYPAPAWPQGARVRTPLRIDLPTETPPGSYRLLIGWYRFQDGQPIWLPWSSGERLALGPVQVVAPPDWSAQPAPRVAHPVGVTIGEGLRLLGFDAPRLEARPGDTVALDLVWQALQDSPQPGAAVLQLSDDDGKVYVETASAPLGGRVPFASLRAGQPLRDPRTLTLPGDLVAGVYTVRLGRRTAEGRWLPIQRGPLPLGTTYPLFTLRVLERAPNLAPPQVQNPAEALFGPDSDSGLRLIGYDLAPEDGRLCLTLYWQALGPLERPHKIFVHLTGAGGPIDIRAQADLYPRLPATAWQPGEYLSDQTCLDLPADLAPGSYNLLVGLYDETSGTRLPVSVEGRPQGDHLLLETYRVGEP